MKRALLGIYFTLFFVCAINPYDRSVWFAENLPILFLVGLFIFISRKYEFSKVSLLCIFILPVMHTIGGHYTFERVPFGFVTDLFGFERNHYDRIAHFSVGLYAYAISEMMIRKGWIREPIVVSVFAVSVIFSVASIYEIFEWLYAVSADSEAGIAVLGSQGDTWDAQKDMLSDGLGAIFAVSIFNLINKNQRNCDSNET
jgi:putative membrane protein